ncbi:gasdermin-E [Salminus brasiliensis]|uniref:gasdermin-E n=1 Tax=Salminus brasiliensis TaxID=930266 RepID=UPI003B82FDC5
MLGNATQRLVRQVDRDGALIAVSRKNDSEKLKPLAVVIKRPAVWFWQTAKYRPTNFTLNDLLQGDPIQIVLEKNEFLKYREKHASSVVGSVEAGVVGISVAAQGHGTSQLSASLGTLCKESVNMQRLLKDSRGRKVDIQHGLVQQTLGKCYQVFTLVIERVFTSCECSIEYSGMEAGKCGGGLLKALGIYPAELHLRESSSLQYDTNVDIELPSGSVLAYSVIQLDIKSDGHYELSACFDGFQTDDDTSQPSLYSDGDVLDGLMVWPTIQKGSPLSVLKEVLSGVKASLRELAQLPVQTRSSLLLLLRQILLDRALLFTLEDKLEMLCGNLRLPQEGFPASETIVKDFLDLLERACTNGTSTAALTQNGPLTAVSYQNGARTTPANRNRANYNGMSPQPACLNGSSSKITDRSSSYFAQSSQNGSSMKSAKLSRSVLTAMHMLVSAAEGLTDDGLISLESLCSPEELCGLNDLVNLLTDSAQPLPIDSLPAALQDEAVLLKVEALFSSSRVTLKREEQLWAEAEGSREILPAVLCVVIHGLAYLSEC